MHASLCNLMIYIPKLATNYTSMQTIFHLACISKSLRRLWQILELRLIAGNAYAWKVEKKAILYLIQARIGDYFQGGCVAARAFSWPAPRTARRIEERDDSSFPQLCISVYFQLNMSRWFAVLLFELNFICYFERLPYYQIMCMVW